MKGAELMASIVAFLVLIGVSIITVGLTVYVISVSDTFDAKAEFTLKVTGLHQPLKYENALLAYLECTDDKGIRMKKILTVAASKAKGPTDDLGNIIIDNVLVTDLKGSTGKIFNTWYGSTPYIVVLEINNVNYLLAGDPATFKESSSKLKLKSAYTKLYTPKGDAELKLYLGA